MENTIYTPEEDYDIVTTDVRYKIECQFCDVGTHTFKDEEKAISAAKALGLVGAYDHGLGTINVCRKCNTLNY